MYTKLMKNIFAVCIILLSNSMYAQTSIDSAAAPVPIPVEISLNTEGWTSQLILDRKFAPDSKFGLFALSYLRADYDNDSPLQESVNLVFAKFDFFKGFGILSGAAYNSHWGFRPYAGGQYTFANRLVMCSLVSGFYLTDTYNYETLAIIEYHPKLKGAWSLYSRAQGIYNLNTQTTKHDRSYLYGRLGLKYKTVFWGAALNCDWYGPMKLNDTQLGGFIGTLLF